MSDEVKTPKPAVPRDRGPQVHCIDGFAVLGIGAPDGDCKCSVIFAAVNPALRAGRGAGCHFEFFNQNPQTSEGAVADSLAKRLFVRRVELVGEIDKREGQNEELETVRSDTATRLHEEVAAMSLDNFIVRPKRLFVEHYAEKAVWENLSDAERADLVNEVAGLPSGFVDDDFDAKQFDLLILRTQLALLRGDHAFESLRKKDRGDRQSVEELQNIPMVAAEMSLILELQTDEDWQDITVPMLETVRRRLRGLIKLIEYKKRAFVYSDSKDEIGAGDEIAVSGVPVGTDMDRFRAKARQFLTVNQNHIAILKLRRNEPLTATDLSELAVVDTKVVPGIRQGSLLERV